MTDHYSDFEAAVLRQDYPGRPAAQWGLLELGWLADSLATFVGDSRGRAEEHSMQLRVLGAAVKSYCDELRRAVATGVEPKVAAETLKHRFADVGDAIQALMWVEDDRSGGRASNSDIQSGAWVDAVWSAVASVPGEKGIGFDVLTDAVWELRQSTASKMRELSAAVELNAKRIEETLTLIA
jgi:hypothetical protein